MITGHDFYMVLSAMTPLYVAMLLAYASVRWWKVFTPDQCAGINRFVSVFAVPLLSFHFISKNNPYTMNWLFIAADTLQKIISLTVLIFWACFTKNGSLDWVITLFSLATQPNTLVMGIPLLVAMYGQYCQSLMVQVVVMQCVIWYTLLLFLFEFRAAKLLIMDQFPDTGASIASVKVESDVVSLDGNDCLEADAIVGGDGKLHVTVRMSNASRPRRSNVAPRPSNFSEAEIYSASTTPRGSSFNPADFYTMTGVQGFPKRNSSFGAGDTQPVFKTSSSRTSNFDETAAHAREVRLSVSESVQIRESKVNPEVENVPKELTKAGSVKSANGARETGRQLPPVGVMTKLILIMVWRRLMRNPNTYSSLIGLIWSLVHFRWNIEMPLIVEKSISILSDAGLGMAMFTLGLFMALQPSLIPCGKARATYAMVVRFHAGPAIMAAAALIFGIRGQLLEVSIVQAALPQGIVPFVFAKEYNVHPQILSTSVIFGMLVALPITLLYYILFGLS